MAPKAAHPDMTTIRGRGPLLLSWSARRQGAPPSWRRPCEARPLVAPLAVRIAPRGRARTQPQWTLALDAPAIRAVAADAHRPPPQQPTARPRPASRVRASQPVSIYRSNLGQVPRLRRG